MSTYGRQILGQTGRDVMVLADLQDAQEKVGGVTFDWSLFTAAGSDTTLKDQTPIKTGEKYARFGQVVCEVTQSEVQTIDLSGGNDPTGGTFDLTIFSELIEGLAYNASAQAVQDAINSLNNDYARRVTVAKSGFVYTLTFPSGAGNVAAVTVDSTDLTGTGLTVNVATTTQGTTSGGKYGPYDPNATDGRQTLSRGKCWIVNRTVKENGFGITVNIAATDHPQVFDGGTVWKDRIVMTSGTHSLAAGPTVTEFEAAFPRIAYAG